MELLRRFSPLFLALSLLGQSSGRAASPPPPYVYAKLGDLQAGNTVPQLPAYTLAEQRLVLKQARLLLLGMYAHLVLKKESFGIDPTLALHQLQDDLKKLEQPMDQATFHGRLMKIFVSERDLHTIYKMPRPFACYDTLLPFSLDPVKIKNSDGKYEDEIAISKLVTTPEIVALSPDLGKLSVGDVITRYDGDDPVKQLRAIDDDPNVSVVELGAGANNSARRRRAVEKLTLIAQEYDPFPQKPQIALEVRKRDGTTLQLSFDWIVTGLNSCIKTAPKPGAAEPSAVASEDYERKYQEIYRPNLHEEPATVEGGDPQLDLSSPKATAEPILHYKLLVRKDPGQPDRSFGYIRLDSFAPTNAYESVITMVQGLLTQEFAGTDGVIIDLRNNGGGTISFGEELIQLFTPRKVEAETFRIRATKANKQFIQETNYSDLFLGFIKKALKDHALYTDSAVWTQQPNTRGQSYFKPVAILTNASCFSTCDMFSAGMQDNGGASLWAEDGNTGGGGANNWQYADFESMVKGTKLEKRYPPLPGGQGIGIAWRQSLRARKNKGVLIEDIGVGADHGIDMGWDPSTRRERIVLPSSPEDLALVNLLSVRAITDDLIAQAGSFPSSAILDLTGPGTFDIKANQPPTLNATLTGTTSIDYFLESNSGETKLGAEAIDESHGNGVALTVPVPDASAGRIALQGRNGQKDAWRENLTYRRVPAPVTAPVAVAIGPSGVPAGMGFFTPDSDPSRGWLAKNGQLQIGPGPTYDNNLTTDASLFITIPAGMKPSLNFTATIDTEAGGDFFRVYVISGNSQSLMAEFSGKYVEKSYSYPLSTYAGQAIEIRFDFTSDPGVNASGVFLKDLSVK